MWGEEPLSILIEDHLPYALQHKDKLNSKRVQMTLGKGRLMRLVTGGAWAFYRR
jgi:hypothetical protein